MVIYSRMECSCKCTYCFGNTMDCWLCDGIDYATYVNEVQASLRMLFEVRVSVCVCMSFEAYKNKLPVLFLRYF